MSAHGLAHTIRSRAHTIDPTSPSTTKWNPVRDLIAEALHVIADDVYVTTVSKPGNLSVRLEQSGGARNADVVAAMYTGSPAQLPECVEAAEKRCAGRLILTFSVDPAAGGWTLLAVVKPASMPLPSTLAREYPGATVVNC
jgi:hypothetical protein